MKSYVDQFLSASHFVVVCEFYEKRHCRCKHRLKIAQRVFTNFKNVLKFANFNEFENRKSRNLELCFPLSWEVSKVRKKSGNFVG